MLPLVEIFFLIKRYFLDFVSYPKMTVLFPNGLHYYEQWVVMNYYEETHYELHN